jgi:hypothetical protein
MVRRAINALCIYLTLLECVGMRRTGDAPKRKTAQSRAVWLG